MIKYKKCSGGDNLDIFKKALNYAYDAHLNQRRKNGGLYIFHPLEVSIIASQMTSDMDVIVASLLHDTIEDTDVKKEDIEKEFGKNVLELVLSETEDKMPGISKEKSWRERKEKSLELLKNTKDIRIKILWLSDKLSNLRSFYKEFLSVGLDVFKLCNQKDPLEQKWYYYKVYEYTSELKDYMAYKEYESLLDKMFK